MRFVMYLTIDVGGTKTLVATFTPEGEMTQSVKFATPKSYDDFLKQLAEHLTRLDAQQFKAAGVAVPGKVNRDEGIGIAFGNLAWENVPVVHDIQQLVACPVKLENDANLAGLSEALLIPEHKRVLYVTIGTGIGGVVIQDGAIDPGTQDAEVGHILLEYQGRLMRWEEFASGQAIMKQFGVKASEIEADDSQKWYLIARNIAIGLIDIIATLTPDVIVIGGGIGTHFPKFRDKLIEELKIYENPLINVPPLLQAKRAEEAVVYGCLELAKRA